MRILILLFLLCSCTQNLQTKNNERSETLLRNDCQLIFIKKSIGSKILNLKANDLLRKIQNGTELSQEEDVVIVMIMNTISLGYLDSAGTDLKKFNFVFDLQKYYDESYFSILKNKYTLCRSSSTLKFKELKIGYVGNPSNCSRYQLVSDPNEGEKIVEYYEVSSDKIRK
jgi:hypothetical protein